MLSKFLGGRLNLNMHYICCNRSPAPPRVLYAYGMHAHSRLMISKFLGGRLNLKLLLKNCY